MLDKATYSATAAYPVVITGHIDMAQKAYRLSRDSAARAAAHAYLVWRATLADGAPAEAYEWLKDQMMIRNEQIEAHNDAEKRLRERATAFGKGKLAELDRDDLALQESEDPNQMALVIAEKNRLKKAVNYTAKEWADRQMTPISTRENASQFVPLVKFVFEFHHLRDSSVTSRYAQMLEWIHTRFKDKAVSDAEIIVEAIQEMGGFDRTLEAQRGKVTPTVKVEDDLGGAERKLMEKYTIEKIVSAFKSASPQATVDLAAQHAQDGFVFLIGRSTGEKIEIIKELEIDEKSRKGLIAVQDAQDVLPTQAASEFIGRVVNLGELVTLEDNADKTEFDLKAGEPVKAERVMTLVPDKKSGFGIVISARRADASVVVKAYPKAEVINLGKIAAPVFIQGSKFGLLSKLVSKASDRRLFTFSQGNTNGAISWKAVNVAVDPTVSTKASRSFVWLDLATEMEKPLDVAGFRPTAEDSFSMERIKGHATEIAGKTSADSSKTIPETVGLLLNGSKADNYEGKTKKSFTMRVKDLGSLFNALLSQMTDEVTMRGDTGGIVMAAFEDELARYEIYVPTAAADGKRLQNRRIEPMDFDVAVEKKSDEVTAN